MSRRLLVTSPCGSDKRSKGSDPDAGGKRQTAMEELQAEANVAAVSPDPAAVRAARQVSTEVVREWEDPTCFGKNKEPAHATLYPAESRAVALYALTGRREVVDCAGEPVAIS
eukprot:6214837-Pleurochrysis_carterae.AAC.15